LRDPMSVAELDAMLSRYPQRLDCGLVGWPVLTIDDTALCHNIDTMAELCTDYGVSLAPHVKTHMSAPIWARQAEAGAWAATVATPQQMRTVCDWGVQRVLLANELVDVMDADRLRAALAADPHLEVWLQVDSIDGVRLLEMFFGPDPVGRPREGTRDRLHVLVEFGVRGGRTGVRTPRAAADLARAILGSGLKLGGITGYEGPAAAGSTPADLAAVRQWCGELVEAARAVRQAAGPARAVRDVMGEGAAPAYGSDPRPLDGDASGPGRPPVPFIVSAGGSAYIDVVLDSLAPRDRPSPLGDGVRVVLRSGAYVTHDSRHYAALNPWSRLPGGRELRAALTVWAPVLSTPEPELALLGAGRRDVGFDAGYPVALWYAGGWTRQPQVSLGALGPRQPFTAPTEVTALNDQHAFLQGPGAADLRVGDVVGLGISHPCTTFDKWRVAMLTSEDPGTGQTLATGAYALDF